MRERVEGGSERAKNKSVAGERCWMGEEGPVNMTVDCLTDDRRPFQKRRPSLLYFYFLIKNLPSLPMIFYDRGHGFGHGQNKPRSNTASAPTISSSFLVRTGHPLFFIHFFVPFRDLQSNFRLNRFLRPMNYHDSQCQSSRRRYCITSITISMIGLQVLVMLDAPRVVDSNPNIESRSDQ